MHLNDETELHLCLMLWKKFFLHKLSEITENSVYLFIKNTVQRRFYM